MGQAILDGFERGFNMMERHKARLGSEDRLSRLDKQNESRYQDSQQRLSDIDEKNDARYKDTLAYREKQMQNQADYRDKTTDATKDYRDWQKNKQEKDTLWAQDQKALGVGWDYFRANGQIAPEHEEMFQRNKGYDPRTFQNPEARNKVKALNSKLGQVIKSGEMSKVNEPETVALFEQVFSDKFSSSVGEYDEAVGAKITSVNFAGFVPVDDKEGSVSLALKVTYDNGSSAIKPMTEGRSSNKDDPVTKMKPQELIGAIQAKMMMADMIERPDYWDKMGESVASNLIKGRRTSGINQEDRTQAAYRKELSAIDKDLTNAVAKIQGNSDLSITQKDREAAIDRVTKTFQQRKNALNESYGVENKGTPKEQPEPKGYKSTVKDHDVDSVIGKFMSANKGMTKEQALTAAMQQGYISE
jgi:hypothetical protein